MEKLKPCLDCSGRPVFIEAERGGFYFKCRYCGISRGLSVFKGKVYGGFSTEYKALKAWNTRHKQ